MSFPRQRTTTRPHRLTGTLTEAHAKDPHVQGLYFTPCERCKVPLENGPYAIEWQQVASAEHLGCGVVEESDGPLTMLAYHAGCAPKLMDTECGGL